MSVYTEHVIGGGRFGRKQTASTNLALLQLVFSSSPNERLTLRVTQHNANQKAAESYRWVGRKAKSPKEDTITGFRLVIRGHRRCSGCAEPAKYTSATICHLETPNEALCRCELAQLGLAMELFEKFWKQYSYGKCQQTVRSRISDQWKYPSSLPSPSIFVAEFSRAWQQSLVSLSDEMSDHFLNPSLRTCVSLILESEDDP